MEIFELYMKEVGRYPLIADREEEREITRRAREGDTEALHRLVTANLRFVISYVKRFRGRGLSLPELVCAGNEGLLEAAKRSDPDSGVKFISYAVWWIRQRVLKALAEQGHIVRIPYGRGVSRASVSWAASELERELGRYPNEHEIADRLGRPVESVRQLFALTGGSVSWDERVAGEPESVMWREIVADTGPDLETESLDAHVVQKLHEAVAALRPHEAEMLTLRYGLDGGGAMTTRRIASLFGCSEGEVRKVLNGALASVARYFRGESAETTLP